MTRIHEIAAWWRGLPDVEHYLIMAVAVLFLVCWSMQSQIDELRRKIR